MLTREEANEIGKLMNLPDTAAGLVARFDDQGKDRLEIALFSINGRPLAICDIITGLSHFSNQVIQEKIAGTSELKWSPRDEAPVQKPSTPPPAPEPPNTYWGG